MLSADDRIHVLVDKPFVYALRDKATGLVLIAGYWGGRRPPIEPPPTTTACATMQDRARDARYSKQALCADRRSMPISCGLIQFYVDHQTVSGGQIQYFGAVPKRTLVPHNPA
jgi:hypothetical protein